MRIKCYNNRCAENKNDYCSEDFMVVSGTIWNTCKDWIKINSHVEEEIPIVKVTNAISSLEVE